MTTKHTIDIDFEYSSRRLKKILSELSLPNFRNALDIPCGNGRNIFLLAKRFKNVKGIDISEGYLNEIKNAKKYYQNVGNIALQKIDIIKEDLPEEIKYFEFICNIHFYRYSLLQNILEMMLPNSFLYVETPTCVGGNFKELPSTTEVNYLFRNSEMVFFEQKQCKQGNAISFTAVLKKTQIQ